MLTPGTVVDRYVVEAEVGRGAMAAVFRVRHRQLNSLHALKVLTVPSQSIRDRLVQEGKLQAALRHPNIVPVTDIVDVNGTPGLVMEYVHGPTLQQFLGQRRLSLAQVDAIATGIVDGVAEAHRNGLVHRDLKPANVLLMLTRNTIVPKVTDFGLAKILDDESGSDMARTRSGLSMGTPHYMAPEQIRNAKGVDQRADVFAVGVILYELSCGVRPFEGADLLDIFNSIVGGRFVHPRERSPNLPEYASTAICRALEVDRDRRWPTCDALLAAWQGREQVEDEDTDPGGRALWPRSMMGASQMVMKGMNGPQPTSSSPAGGQTWGGADGQTATFDSPSRLPAQLVSAAEVTLPPAEASLAPGEGTLTPESIAPQLVPLPSAVQGRPRIVQRVAITAIVLSIGGLSWWWVDMPAEIDHPTAGVEGTDAIPAVRDAGTTSTSAQGEQPAASSPPPSMELEPSKPALEPAPASTTTAATPPKRKTSASTPAAPLTAATPAPVAAPTVPTMATVAVKGDAAMVTLDGPNGRFRAGDVPPGTYTVRAIFGDDAEIPVGEITLLAGQSRTLNCSAGLITCR